MRHWLCLLCSRCRLDSPLPRRPMESSSATSIARSSRARISSSTPNGGWRASNPIPASMPRWSRRWAAGEQAKEQLKVILDEASAMPNQPMGSIEQLIGDHYAACMNEPLANQLGITPLRSAMATIEAIDSPAALQAVIRHSMGWASACRLRSAA